MAKIDLQDVPARDDPEYMNVLITNTVTAYRKFLSDSMALDYCGIVGKQRALIIDNKDYKRMTRTIRAEKYLDEIDEIEELTIELRGGEPKDSDVDIRESKDPDKEYQKQYKDWFAMKLKAAEMRRDLLKMSKTEDEKEEADAMNIFFIALTREEFEAMETTDVHDGDESGKEALAEAKAEQGPAAAKSIIAEANKDEVEGGYKLNADGTAEDF